MNTLRKMNTLVRLRSLGGGAYRLYSAKDQKPKAQEKLKEKSGEKAKSGEKGNAKGKGAGGLQFGRLLKLQNTSPDHRPRPVSCLCNFQLICSRN